MTRQTGRDGDGRFAPGYSGNPDGARRRKPRELLTLTDVHRIVLEVAGEVIGHRNGKPVTRLENAIRCLATGQGENRLALRDHVEMTKSATHHFWAEERRKAITRPRS